MHQILKPFMLRRTKNDIKDEIGSKEIKNIICEMSLRQKQLYSDILESKLDYENIIMQLKKVCNHPDLFEKLEPVCSFGFNVLGMNDYVGLRNNIKRNIFLNLNSLFLDGEMMDNGRDQCGMYPDSLCPDNGLCPDNSLCPDKYGLNHSETDKIGLFSDGVDRYSMYHGGTDKINSISNKIDKIGLSSDGTDKIGLSSNEIDKIDLSNDEVNQYDEFKQYDEVNQKDEFKQSDFSSNNPNINKFARQDNKVTQSLDQSNSLSNKKNIFKVEQGKSITPRGQTASISSKICKIYNKDVNSPYHGDSFLNFGYNTDLKLQKIFCNSIAYIRTKIIL